METKKNGNDNNEIQKNICFVGACCLKKLLLLIFGAYVFPFAMITYFLNKLIDIKLTT